MIHTLQFVPGLNGPDLLPAPVADFIKQWGDGELVEVAEIDPAFTGSKEFCEHYGVPAEETANCVIVEAVRGEKRTLAACLVPMHLRADLNKTARKTLDARRVSFAPLDEVLEKTGMEYGSITPIGLPNDWPILIDAHLLGIGKLIIGGGLVKSKLRLPGQLLSELPNAVVIENLGI